MIRSKYIYSFLSLLSLSLLLGCDEDDSDNVSFVTSYPVFEIEGGEVFSVVAGNTFTDPGIKATENGAEIAVTTTGQVDATTPGLYYLTYTATNSDGFSATTSRMVAVTAEDVSSIDISGTYYRESNLRESEVTKLAPGVYLMTDCWGTASSGSSPLLVNTYLLHTGGDDLVLEFNESGAPFGGNVGTGTILPDRLSLDVTLVGVSASRTNVWIRKE